MITQSASTGAAPTKINNMKTNQLVALIIPGVIAAIVLLLSFRSPVNADTLIGFGTIAVLLALLALEYRFSWKRLLRR